MMSFILGALIGCIATLIYRKKIEEVLLIEFGNFILNMKRGKLPVNSDDVKNFRDLI